jgi:hypothetical protein
MSEFILFEKAFYEYENRVSEDCSVKNDSIKGISACFHDNTASEKGINICIDCGEEIIHIFPFKDWKYYDQHDTKSCSDPSRVQTRKSDERGIFKDVENLGFSENIVAKANKLYAQVTEGKILRGNSRKAVIFACIFHSYKISGKPQSHEKLIKVFNLSRKTSLKGLKLVNLYAPKNSKIRTTYITPVNLIDEIMDDIFAATKEQKEEVIQLYYQVKNKSSRLNRSRPQSVSAALIYYWSRLKKKEISLKDFTKKVDLSELTINKIAKEIADVLNTSII